SYWFIQNLELSYAGDGLEITYGGTTGYAGLVLNNLYIHDLSGYWEGMPADPPNRPWNSTGITIFSSIIDTITSPAVLSGFVISNCTITNSGTGYHQPSDYRFHQ